MEEVERLKAELDAQRPLATRAIDALRHYYDIELTHTSTAIEGNTLTARETAEVIEHGITVGGKPLRDHLEVLDHHDALGWMRETAGRDEPLDENTATELHRRVMWRSRPDIAGRYGDHQRRIIGSAALFPGPAEVPALMSAFGDWLRAIEPGPALAFETHSRLTSILPFSKGNGLTARLLMNLILIRAGYPPVAIRLEDRARYLASLERAHLTGVKSAYEELLTKRLRDTLVDYLEIAGEALPA